MLMATVVRVIEDSCQAHGARYHGRRAGSLGDLACFSFYFSKNLGAYGEAGAVTTNDPALAEEMEVFRSHGSRVRYQHEMIGRNARMDEIQAAVLGIKLRYLDQWNAQRRPSSRVRSRRWTVAHQRTLPCRDQTVEPIRWSAMATRIGSIVWSLVVCSRPLSRYLVAILIGIPHAGVPNLQCGRHRLLEEA